MRKSGVLMHITSLPGLYGVGTMGRKAYEFVDFLKRAGQSCWQVLPMTPTGYGNSPYQSLSDFAGNPYLIDLELLVREGLLTHQELDDVQWGDREDKVDFGLLSRNRIPLLRLAYSRFDRQDTLDEFCRENSSWLWDYALFLALKDANDGKAWFQWEDGLKYRRADAVWSARRLLCDEVRFYCFVQYLFFKQWDALQTYAHNNGISIIGDVPIYVPLDSVDVWANPELFQLDAQLIPTDVAGVPPDGFAADGQLWGNPLYRWEVSGGMAIAGGCVGWKRRANATTWCDLIIFVVWKAIGLYPMGVSPRGMAAG